MTTEYILLLIVLVLVLGPPAIASIYASNLLIIDRILDRTRNSTTDKVDSKEDKKD